MHHDLGKTMATATDDRTDGKQVASDTDCSAVAWVIANEDETDKQCYGQRYWKCGKTHRMSTWVDLSSAHLFVTQNAAISLCTQRLNGAKSCRVYKVRVALIESVYPTWR